MRISNVNFGFRDENHYLLWGGVFHLQHSNTCSAALNGLICYSIWSVCFGIVRTTIFMHTNSSAELSGKITWFQWNQASSGHLNVKSERQPFVFWAVSTAFHAELPTTFCIFTAKSHLALVSEVGGKGILLAAWNLKWFHSEPVGNHRPGMTGSGEQKPSWFGMPGCPSALLLLACLALGTPAPRVAQSSGRPC